MTFKRLVHGGLSTLVVGIALAACVPEPPPPPDPLISCSELAVSVNYSPPAQDGNDDVTVTAQPGSELSGCTDATGQGITGGTLTGTMQLQDACLWHPSGQLWGTGSGQITWSNGSVSTYTAQLEAPIVFKLAFTGGLWAGATAYVPMRSTGGTGSCAGTGLTSLSMVSDGPFVLHPAGSTTRPPLTGVEQVAAGGYHACALMAGGSVRCWGNNTYGQLGNGTSDPGIDAVVPVEVTGLAGVSAVAAGENHTCALLGDGSVWCWGANSAGQLGDGTTAGSPVPVQVSGVVGATVLTAGVSRSCVVLGDGTVSCWGAGVPSASPIAGITGATAVSAGGSHACALVAGGAVRCWGSNDFGELGDGTMLSSATPVDAVGIAGATSVVAGPYDTTCAVLAGGTVRCWGANAYGQLGDGTTTGSSLPVPVVGITGATSVGLGAVHSCASLGDGSSRCWGNNNYGQLGDGTNAGSTTPVPVAGPSDLTSIAVGHYATCARTAAATARCWGANGEGQLGNGTHDGTNTPVGVISSL